MPTHLRILALTLLLLLATLFYAGWHTAEFKCPLPTILVLDQQGAFLDEVGGQDLGYWPLETLPQRVAIATLTIEDRRFWNHPGIDLLAIGRALRDNLEAGARVSGASTIAMQVARLQSPGSRTYTKKLLEALQALFLTLRHGRKDLLRHYLRIVPYGNRIHGIAYAARRYFDKPVDDLSWAEVAFLTALPQAPSHMNPYHPDGQIRATRRAKHILQLLKARGALFPSEYAQAITELERLHIPGRSHRPAVAMHAILSMNAAIRRTQASSLSPLPHQLTSTLNLTVQRQMAGLAADALRDARVRGAGNVALMVIDLRDFSVLASVGSADYFDGRARGAIDYTQVPRMTGSALKPFLYASGYEGGLLHTTDILEDLERGPQGEANIDRRFLGPLLPRQALANSRNIPAVRLLERLGLDATYGLFQRLGLHDHHLPASHFGSGLVIGALPVTLQAMARAYTVLAGDGRRHALRWWYGQSVPPPTRVFSQEIAQLVTRQLSDPMARLPSFPRMGHSELPFAAAFKTGSSSGFRDAWTFAWSTRYLIGVWLGHPDHSPMQQVTGYNTAAKLAHAALALLHTDQMDGMADHAFPPPSDHALARVCPMSGAAPTQACDQVLRVWRRTGDPPLEPCQMHLQAEIDTRTGALAGEDTPRAFTRPMTFVQLPPPFARWAKERHLPRPPDGLVAWPRQGLERQRRALRQGDPVQLRITSPQPHALLLRDPEAPEGQATVALSVVVDPPVSQVVWYVDDEPFQTVDYPFATRWPMEPGVHRFQARVPFAPFRSQLVHTRFE